MTIIEVANISAEVEWKNIKNVHLTIYPPNARVHVSAPIGMAEEAVRLFLITKMSWINQRVSQVLDQSRQTPREYVSGENHYFKGHRYRLKVLYHHASAKVEIQGNEYIKLYVREGTTAKTSSRSVARMVSCGAQIDASSTYCQMGKNIGCECEQMGGQANENFMGKL